jgi:hypothetical protein
MAQYSMADAIKKLINDSSWKQRYLQSRIRLDWEKIMGKTVSKYTEEVKLIENKLVIKTNVAALKNELNMSKHHVIETVNNYLQEKAVHEVIIL